MTTTLDRYIETNEGIRGGKPRIVGTRIAVVDIAVWHLYEQQTFAAIAAEHHLPLAAVYAAMAYYYNHQGAVDARARDDEAFAEALRDETPSRLPTTLRTPPRA